MHVQKIRRIDDEDVGDSLEIQMCEMVLVAGDEIVDPSGDGGGKNGPVFVDQPNRLRHKGRIGIADNLSAGNELVKTEPLGRKFNMAAHLINGVGRGDRSHVRQVPKSPETAA